MKQYDLSFITNWEVNCFQKAHLKEIPDVSLWEPIDGSDAFFQRMDPKIRALILSSGHVHLPRLHHNNISEWIYRLDSLFDAGVSFLHASHIDGDVPIKILSQDLQPFTGLTIDVKPWDSMRFDRHIRFLRTHFSN